MKRWLLISGLPGSGKSTFVSWLASEKQFFAVDMERGGIDRLGLRDSWDKFFSGHDREAFPNILRARNQSIVLDWNFPPSCLHVVSVLMELGFELWWFDGDWLAARASFVRRGSEPVQAFDCHVGRLISAWQFIEPLVGANVVRTIRADGSFLSADETWQRVERGAA